MDFNMEEELKKLPAKPGVYLMHDENDTIIYVGKAISLKNRVRQYFQSSRNKSPKIEKMVSKIARFEYIITDSELEALILECNLIKEHRPQYNTMLKDDKSYPYICVTVEETFPRVMYAHDRKRDKSRYFGPYTNVTAVNDILEMLQKLFYIRTCNRFLPKEIGKDRPCLNYHLKRCKAPCQGFISKEDYRKSISKVLDFLSGKYSGILEDLEKKMMSAAEEMEFEKAIEYRELIGSIKHISEKQKITDDSMEDRDIIAFAVDHYEENALQIMKSLDAVVQVFFVREGKIIGRDHFHLNVAEGETNAEIMTSFVKQFYAGTPFIPKELLLQYPLEEEEIISQWLSNKRGKKVTIKVPKKGEKERLVELAEKNARMVLDQDKDKIKKEEIRTLGAMNQIKEWLGMKELHRIEAYDISNISGFEAVGSMVVYEDGKPKRSDFRKFRIKWVKGVNDYASMEEVLTRRFVHRKKEQEAGVFVEHGFGKLPDLIMMDGGRGQVNVALDVLKKLGLHIPVCGMVKDEHHRTRGIYFNNEEIPIDTHGEGFHLVTRIQDEAHRFAIEYHRSLRNQNNIHSILDEIPGIGPKRRNALMRSFENLEEIQNADEARLMEVEGMNVTSAQAVYNFFQNKQKETEKKADV